jgi:hypothetical protein
LIVCGVRDKDGDCFACAGNIGEELVADGAGRCFGAATGSLPADARYRGGMHRNPKTSPKASNSASIVTRGFAAPSMINVRDHDVVAKPPT